MKLDKPIHELTGTDLINIAKSIDKKTWIKIGIGAAAALFVFYFIVKPAWMERAAVKSQIAATEGQIIRLQTLKRKEKGWLQDKEDFNQYIYAVKDRLFLPGETSLLLGKISKLAQESSVSVIASTPRSDRVEFPKPFDERYRAELYDFTLEGGYHELARFIGKIESHRKILRVELFQISPREKTPGKHLADLTLSAVSLKQDKA